MLTNFALFNKHHFGVRVFTLFISCLCFFSTTYAEENPISVTGEYDEIKEEYVTKHDIEPWADEQELAAAKNRRINLYYLATRSDGVIQWNAPDGNKYFINPTTAISGKWSYDYDNSGKKVMAYLHDGKQDAKLQLSLKGANSIISTLMHSEDDSAHEPIYIAVDMGNESSNKLNPYPALTIRSLNRVDDKAPLRPGGAWYVMTVCAKPKCK